MVWWHVLIRVRRDHAIDNLCLGYRLEGVFELFQLCRDRLMKVLRIEKLFHLFVGVKRILLNRQGVPFLSPERPPSFLMRESLGHPKRPNLRPWLRLSLVLLLVG